MVEAVKKDLGLTDNQIGKIKDFVKIDLEFYREFLAKSHELLPPSRPFPHEEFEAREREFRTLSEDFKRKQKELGTKILAVLTPSQSERLKQIRNPGGNSGTLWQGRRSSRH